MNQKLIFGIGITIVVIDLIVFFRRGTTQTNNSSSISAPTIKKESIVSLPQETDIIQTFVNSIDEGRSFNAVKMMGPKVLNNDSNKQAWAVMFNAFESIKVINIEPSMQSNWSENIHTYQITLDVKMKPEVTNISPIPNYGWDNGKNIRWISLEKIDDKWTVQGFATGP